jgi:peptidyl-prolyl cis-trans isomerase D
MLSVMRKAARSWVAGILIGLLVISFAVWGINDVFTGSVRDSVARVAGKDIAPLDYRAEFDRLLKRAGQEAGRPVSTEEARKQGLDNAVLERMVADRAFAAFTESLGVRVADTALKEEIAKIPAFQDPTTGRFSEAAYFEALQSNGFTVASFEESVRNDLTRQMVVMAATSGMRAPDMFARQALAYATERRMVTVVPVAAALAGAPRQPTQAELVAFHAENRAALMRPETRDLTLAIGRLSDFSARATVDEAQVRQVFDQQKASLVTPATRSFVQIVAPDKAKADAAAARLRAGEAPDAIAAALGLQKPLSFEKTAEAAVPDKQVAAAVFAASAGTIGAVQGALSFSAFRVSEANAATPADFNAVAPRIREELRKDEAGRALTNASEAFDDAIAGGATLEAAAQKAGFPLVRVARVTADGRDMATGQPVAALAEATEVLREAFAGGRGDVSDLLSAPGDSYVAVRIDAITPSAPAPLAEVREELAAEWVRRDLAQRLKARADAILADARASGLEAAARKAGLPALRQPQPLLRGQGSPELSNAVFEAKKGGIVSGPAANGVEYAIVRVDDILRDDPKTVPARVAEAEQAVRQTIQRDIVDTLERVARNRAKVALYPDRMRRALGDTAETETGAPAPAPAATPAATPAPAAPKP